MLLHTGVLFEAVIHRLVREIPGCEVVRLERAGVVTSYYDCDLVTVAAIAEAVSA